MADLRPSYLPAFTAFSLPATVTPPGGSAISTTAVWVTPQTVDVPILGDARVAEPRRVLALRRDQVPSAPRATVIAVAERAGQPTKQWRVDGVDRADEGDVLRVVVVPI